MSNLTYLLLLALLTLPAKSLADTECGLPPKGEKWTLAERINDCGTTETLATESGKVVSKLVTRTFDEEGEPREVWKQAEPAGLIWSDVLSTKYSYDELMVFSPTKKKYVEFRPDNILTVCKLASAEAALGRMVKLNWRLPSVKEWAGIGIPEQEYQSTISGNRFFQLLPRMEGNFWSSTLHHEADPTDPESHPAWAWYFAGFGQTLTGQAWYYAANAPGYVRCVTDSN